MEDCFEVEAVEKPPPGEQEKQAQSTKASGSADEPHGGAETYGVWLT
jgi:hypothetical protein